ncbi:MAG: T9SS type A sorting domain-containing protein [Bacteroidales bacterium]
MRITLLWAQEELIIPTLRVQKNITKSTQTKQERLNNLTLDTLELPFFDDFSSWYQSPIPNQQKWTNNNVFINNTYGINPPTMGVATFDIIDATGKIYANAGPYSFSADTLTSKPIAIKSTDNDIYLSFLYQPQGLGDKPEGSDSLVVQFFSPSKQIWISIWQVRIIDSINFSESPFYMQERFFVNPSLNKNIWHDTPVEQFFRVILPVTQSCFLEKGFQFRFINYASRAAEDIGGKLSNCDMWNIDLVYLNKNRHEADFSITDIATQTPILQLLKEYRSMPWKHLKNSPTAQREQLVNADGRTTTVSVSINNLSTNDNDFRLHFNINCVKGAGTTSQRNYDAGAISSTASTISNHTFNLPATDFLNMPLANADSVKFELSSILDEYRINANLADDLRINDTCVFHQDFFTYYAYDDGSAENGYGVFGSYADRSKVAVKYNAYQRDTLSGIYIYFNHTQDTGNIQPFKLTIWSDRGGLPSTELYTSENEYTRFDEFHQFIFYKLKYPVVVDGPFYIGWIQQSTAMLNVGFDVNSKPSGKMLLSLDGNKWTTSRFDGLGALMIRPSFARLTFDASTSIKPIEEKKTNLLLYPNPTKENIKLQLPESLQNKILNIEIFTLQGRMIMQALYTMGTGLNVGTLPTGVYFLRVVNGQNIVGYARFIKQ